MLVSKINEQFILKLANKLLSRILLVVFCVYSPFIWATYYSVDPVPQTEITNIEDKLYRQALYFYFQADYSQALSQMEMNKSRLTKLNSTSQLFSAGLQLSVGLQYQAKETLVDFKTDEERVDSAKNEHENLAMFSTQNELLLVALLQLTEQYVQQGLLAQAKQTLAQITTVPKKYYQQYHSLSQLTFWPDSPVLAPVVSDETIGINSGISNGVSGVQHSEVISAYVQMNIALRHVELGEFYIAQPLLITLKNQQWKKETTNFWQSLFNSSFNDSPLNDSSNNDVAQELLQHQAVNDYARLLLAQMYVNQEKYQEAYNELKGFPEHSPYAESALFLFAFSAQQIKQHTVALNLLKLLADKYTYSNLAWQSGLLMAAQITEQNSLEEGFSLYQKLDVFYKQRLVDLQQFERDFNGSGDLLKFSISDKAIALKKDTVNDSTDTRALMKLATEIQYSPRAKWLQKSLNNVELSGMYHELIELDLLAIHVEALQKKNDWLADTLKLNQIRKQNVAAKQQQQNYQKTIELLTQRKNKLQDDLSSAEIANNGQAFANTSEQVLLTRINKSQKSIGYLHGAKNTDDYQVRLKRVAGVLAWQLNQSYPERLWSYQKQLNEINQLLLEADRKLSNFNALTQANNNLPLLTQRQQQSNKQLFKSLESIKQLRNKTTLRIRQHVIAFIGSEHKLLEEHLLDTKKSMAGVLEQMALKDKKIEQQLIPDEVPTLGVSL